MTMSRTRIAELDQWFPPAGPCAFCGSDDKRHRLWDALIGFHKAGDSVEWLARAYDYPVEAIEAVIRIQPWKRKQ